MARQRGDNHWTRRRLKAGLPAGNLGGKKLPEPVKLDSRICFGIAYFTSEEDAQAYDRYVRMNGRTYNGGFFHGMSCGRDKTWDHVDQSGGYLHGKQLYAVTH